MLFSQGNLYQSDTKQERNNIVSFLSKMKTCTFLFLYLTGSIVLGFEIYWNVPTQQCKANYQMDFVKLLRNYGIQINNEDKFQGEKVTIFYESQLGYYPNILRGKMENGGIPQKGDLSKHLEKAATDLTKIIPQMDFDGLGVIDWESWRPTWEFNWEPLRIYQTKSIEYARELNPTLNNETAIQQIAQSQWEKNAKYFMLNTLELAKKMRPKASWCYYLFPDCYNYVGKKPKDFECSKAIRNGNNKLEWLWKASTALCPSIYVYENQIDRYTLEERMWKDNGKLKEALRVASRKAKIFPYINYFDKNLIPGEEFWRMVAQAAASGANGVVIWGASASVSSESHCKNLKQYILDTIGPAAERVAWKSSLCEKQICNSQGKCTWPQDESAKAWRLLIDNDINSFYAGNITCRCLENYTGRFCNEKIK